ncbi:MAG: hypothetical protein ABL307_13995 [Roseitalea porphyridii]|uniref:hypothetical protein n=1 Tax=Roseitalea porphyridii TaxID=1852022 RepID=UPI0032D936AC
MIRFILVTVSIICLALAVIFAVLDLTRSIGADAPVLTPLAESWDGIAPGTRESLADWLASTVHPFVGDPVLATFVTWPTFAVLAGLALMFGFLARLRRRKRSAIG